MLFKSYRSFAILLCVLTNFLAYSVLVAILNQRTIAMFFLITSLFIILCGFCNTQEFDSSYNETGDCTEGIKCINQYIDLEIYVMKNNTLLEILTQTLFPTGGSASKFVKITYNFLTSNGKELVEDRIKNCSIQQSTYIWSELLPYIFLAPRQCTGLHYLQ